MRWRQAGMGVLVLLMMSGCPSEFGKDGRIAKAIHKDTVDMVITRCSEARKKEVCEGPKRDAAECEKCGG